MNYKKFLPKRQQSSHKGTFGKVLNIAGNINFQGAAFLSSVAALKVGAGYLTLACPQKIINNIASLTPDVTFLPLDESPLTNFKIIEAQINKFSSVSIGCGLGTQERTLIFVEKIIKLLTHFKTPLIIDADALNAIAILGIKKLPSSCIITPHEAEMARLLNTSVEEISSNRLFQSQKAVKKLNCVTILKGHNTIICDKINKTITNQTGNSALAKAGSGDVLTGIITGLAAQGCPPYESAALGVYLHGLCGELASKEFSEYSVLASDLIDFIPKAIKYLNKN